MERILMTSLVRFLEEINKKEVNRTNKKEGSRTHKNKYSKIRKYFNWILGICPIS